MWSLFQREMKIHFRVGGGAMIGVVFFLAVVTIIPFGVGPDMALLGRIGPAILWVAALLATLLGLDRLFQADQEDGSLDLILMGEMPLSLAVFIKIIAHWLATGLPLVVAAPVLGLLLNVPPAAMVPVVLTLLVGTPALTAIGAIGAAISVMLKKGGLLMAVLVLPLAIPVLIFGVAATTSSLVEGVPFGFPFLMLCALSLMSLVMGPLASAMAIRFGLE